MVRVKGRLTKKSKKVAGDVGACVNVIVFCCMGTTNNGHQLHYMYLSSSYNYLLPRCIQCRCGLAIRILFVCPSVKRVICDKIKKRSVQIFISYERSFSLVFCEEKWLVGATAST